MKKTKHILITKLQNEKCKPKGEWEKGYNAGIEDSIEIVESSGVFQGELNQNLILDTKAYLFIQNLMTHIKLVYGIEQIEFKKYKSDIRDYMEVGFKHKRYNSTELERSFFTITFAKSLELGCICPKCEKNVKVSWYNFEKVRCNECETFLYDHIDKDIIFLQPMENKPNIGDIVKW